MFFDQESIWRQLSCLELDIFISYQKLLFHYKLSIKQKIVKKFPKFHQEILIMRGKTFIFSLKSLISCYFSAWYSSWYIDCIKIDNNAIRSRYFPQKCLNHIGDLFEKNFKMRSWENLREKLDFDEKRKFYWIQFIHTILIAWKEMFLECGNSISNLIVN